MIRLRLILLVAMAAVFLALFVLQGYAPGHLGGALGFACAALVEAMRLREVAVLRRRLAGAKAGALYGWADGILTRRGDAVDVVAREGENA